MTVCGLLRLDGVDVRRSTLTTMLASSALGLPALRGVHLDGPFGIVTAADVTGGAIPPIAVDDSGLTVVVLTAPRAAAASMFLVPPLAPRPVPGPGQATERPRPVTRTRRAAPTVAGHGRGISGMVSAPVGHDHAGGDAGDRAGAGGDEPCFAGGRDGCTVACRIAAAYRAVGERCLRGLDPDTLVVVWDSAVRRLLVTRTGRHAVDLLTVSDGHHVVFGTEPAHLLAAVRSPLGRLVPRPVGTRTWQPRALGATGTDRGDLVGVTPTGGLGRIRQLAPGDRISVTAARRARRGPLPALRLVTRPGDGPAQARPAGS